MRCATPAACWSTCSAPAPDDDERTEKLRTAFPEVTGVTLAELVEPRLAAELDRSLTRQRVQQYQRYFSDADRVLDPHPPRPRPRRHRQRPGAAHAAAAHQADGDHRHDAAGVAPREPADAEAAGDQASTRSRADQFAEFDKIALVDVQPHYFGDALRHVDLVVDHHPETTGYTAVFKDIRAHYGSTSTILTEHLRAVDLDISERTATAMLYAIKSDTLFFNRQANRADLDAFSFLYPLADAGLIRKMEGAEITRERLDYVIKAWQQGRMMEHVFCAFLGEPPRDDFIPYVADFYLQLEDVQWTVVSGVVNDQMVVSVRNLGYSRNAGDFVRRWFNDIGSAGGHRTMAKAVVPLEAFQNKFGTHEGSRVNQRMLDLVLDFLHELNGKK